MTTISVLALDLRSAIARVQHAMGNDLRPILGSVLLEATVEGFFVLAADNYRLARAKVQLADGSDALAEWGRCAIPRRELPSLLAWLRADKYTVQIERAQARGSSRPDHLVFSRAAGGRLDILCVHGEYPNYAPVLEKVALHPRTVTVKSGQLRQALADSGNDVPVYVTFGAWDEPIRVEATDYVEVLMPVRDVKKPEDVVDTPEGWEQPLRRMLDNSPCWCLSSEEPHAGWLHSPVCITRRVFVHSAWFGDATTVDSAVRVGQVWRDNETQPERHAADFVIEAVEGSKVHVRRVGGGGKARHIRVDRLLHVKGVKGYTLVSEP